MFLGEVLSDFRLLLWQFASCTVIVCLCFALFGNKFLIIKKKRKKKNLNISIGLFELISTQKVLKTCYKQGSK